LRIVALDVEITAMSTVCAFNIVSSQVLLSVGWVFEISHTSILPWIFNGVDEEDVISSHGSVSVVRVGILNGWWSQFEIECSLAVIDPVVTTEIK